MTHVAVQSYMYHLHVAMLISLPDAPYPCVLVLAVPECSEGRTITGSVDTYLRYPEYMPK
jgi:hypothetical protein